MTSSGSAGGRRRGQPARPRPGILRGRSSITGIFVAGGGTVAVAASLGLFGAAEPAAFFFVGVATVAALAGSCLVRRPSRRWPWAVIALSFVLFLVAASLRAQLGSMGDISTDRSFVPDLVALPGYVLLAAGLLGFSSRSVSGPSRQSSVVLDGLLAALALAAVAWVVVIEPVILQTGLPLSVMLVMIAYPSMSIFMVVVTLRIVFNPQQERVPSFWYLLAGMTLMFVGDMVYLFSDLRVAVAPAWLLDLPYGLAFVMAGATALHPTMVKLTEACNGRNPAAGRFRIAVVAVALLIPALLTLAARGATFAENAVLSALMVAMTGTAVLRLVQALRTAEQSEARLVHQAYHDSLTGLPNRRMMEEHLSSLLRREPVDGTHVALLYLDLDRFKLINDTLGHKHGDELLVEVSDRLRANVRPTDLVTRIGGDEFMIVLGSVVSLTEALDLANRLRRCLCAPFEVRGMTFYVSASIGLAFASGEDRHATAEILVRDADTAMYQAKDAGRDAVAVFDESMRERVAERVELERDLHEAIAARQLHLVYQPIVDLDGGAVRGMEALLRWSHPRHGVIPPSKFIVLAEENGLIGELGDWVLEHALAQLAAWRRQSGDMERTYVSVNLSGIQLYDDGIVQRVADLLAMNRLEGDALCLELTESVVMEDPRGAAGRLDELRRLGVLIAIDDFGSEYSSLAYLRRFPVDVLKIDKEFVDPLGGEDAAEDTLIATIVAMADILGIATTAEGVETRAQAERLRELGCGYIQGYFCSRPVGADRLPELVTSLSAPRLRLVTQ